MRNLSVMLKAYVFIICLLLFSCKKDNKPYIEKNAIEKLEGYFHSQLDSSIIYLDSLSLAKDIGTKQKYYKQARVHFKKTEPILASRDRENYKSLNAPNILKVEEEDLTDIKIKKPFGFQVLEEELYAELPDTVQLQLVAQHTVSRMRLVRNNLHLKLKDHHLLWLIREELLRITTLGITGFDSPVLESSLGDAQKAYESLKTILNIYKENFNDISLWQKWNHEILDSQKSLNGEFNDFDRYGFIKNHIDPQLDLWNRTVLDWKVDFPFEMAITNNATSFFSGATFNIDSFLGYDKNLRNSKAKIALGQQLFNDTNLSTSNSMSCATCHRSELAFTDGLKKFPGQLRNTPTLKYAALQKAFFYDKRSGSLEGQIVSVIKNEFEFHSDLENLVKTVKKDSNYTKYFKSIYKKGVTDENIRNAIASYIRSLSPFNSKFDRNISGHENSLTDKEIQGFNLFMGKAKCATCHFAPLFNGTVPPDYRDTEIELLGVPADTSAHPVVDEDPGAFDRFQTENRRHFFKTPTIRNISETAPYMHNGVYTTLEQVIEFYNNGGGTGLGLNLEHQTLPPDSLYLNNVEIESLIAFMNSLSDMDSPPSSN